VWDRSSLTLILSVCPFFLVLSQERRESDFSLGRLLILGSSLFPPLSSVFLPKESFPFLVDVAINIPMLMQHGVSRSSRTGRGCSSPRAFSLKVPHHSSFLLPPFPGVVVEADSFSFHFSVASMRSLIFPSSLIVGSIIFPLPSPFLIIKALSPLFQ